MNKEQRKILEKICEKTGEVWRFVHYKGTGQGNDEWLRGFLLMPITARCVFGAKMGYIFYDCTRSWEAWQVGTMTEEDFEPIQLKDWEYHLQQMSLLEDNNEILQYYSKYL